MSEVTKKYILNAIELYKSQIEYSEREMARKIRETYPRAEDIEPIQEIIDEVRTGLPEKYGVKWVGKKYDCCKERFYIQVNVYIDTADVETYNEKSREKAEEELKKRYEAKKRSLNSWNAEAWIKLANKEEIPVFDPSLEFELSVFGGGSNE